MKNTKETSWMSITRVKHESYFEMKNEHYHSFYEIYYLLSGNRKFFLNNKIYNLKSGEMMVIPKREIHRTTYYSEGVHERIAFCFNDEFIKDLKNEIGENIFEKCFNKHHIIIPINRREYLEDLFEKLFMEKYLQENNENDEISYALSKRYCEEIILFIIRCQSKNTDIVEKNMHRDIHDTEIESAAAYMSSHFHDNLTLKKMAEMSCMSDTYFSKRFKHVTGFGFKEYLNELRIHYACHLLLTTNKSITEIASECGFMDSNYFGDAFKKKKKISPLQYRKTNIV